LLLLTARVAVGFCAGVLPPTADIAARLSMHTAASAVRASGSNASVGNGIVPVRGTAGAAASGTCSGVVVRRSGGTTVRVAASLPLLVGAETGSKGGLAGVAGKGLPLAPAPAPNQLSNALIASGIRPK
jgi:hypothetical protein